MLRVCAVFLLIAAGAACVQDTDCNLNGVCNVNTGECACDAAWTGGSCETLALLPAARGQGTCDPSLNGTATGYTTTWGGNPVVDPSTGIWHVHVAEMANHCGMCAWGSQSAIAHYTSTAGPLGPYSRVDTAVGPFSHNPVVLPVPPASRTSVAWPHTATGSAAHRDSGGQSPGTAAGVMYLMFHIGIGCNSEGVWACNYTALPACENGTTPSPIPHGGGGTPIPTPGNLTRAHTHMSSSLDGPWVSIPSNWSMPSCGNNPSPIFLPNASLLLLCHSPMSPYPNGSSCPRSCGLFTAVSRTADWAMGEYDFNCLNVVNPTVVVDGTTWSCANEDPHVYADGRGGLHILTHNQSPGYSNTSWYGGDVRGDGGHLFSADNGTTWTFTWHAAYSGLVPFTDGTQVRYKRERPKVVQDAATGAIIALANGVGVELLDAFQAGNDSACTLVMAVQT